MEDFVYTTKHLPVLKKYGTMRILFLLLGCLVILLQSITWLIVWYKDMTITAMDMAFVGVTLTLCLFFIASQVFLAGINARTISGIKINGLCAGKKPKAPKNVSVAGGFRILIHFITILFVVLLGVLIVSFVQNYLNWGEVILKMPFMVYCSVSLLNVSANTKYKSLLGQIQYKK